MDDYPISEASARAVLERDGLPVTDAQVAGFREECRKARAMGEAERAARHELRDFSSSPTR